MPRKTVGKDPAPQASRRSARIAKLKGKQKKNKKEKDDHMEVDPPKPPPSEPNENKNDNGKDLEMKEEAKGKGDESPNNHQQPPSQVIPDDAHPDPAIRAVAAHFLEIRNEYAEALVGRKIILGSMKNWTEAAIMKWTRAHMPAAERAVGIMFGAELKRKSLWMIFERQHGATIDMIDNMEKKLVNEGFDPALFDDNEIEKELNLGNELDDVKDDSGREKKDDNNKGDAASVTASEDRYHPDQELSGGTRGASRTKLGRRRVRFPARDPGNGNANGNGSSHNGAPEAGKDDADMILEKEKEKMKEAIAKKEAENKALLEQLKKYRERDSENLEIDGSVLTTLDEIMKKKKGRKGSDVSYSYT